MPLKKLHLLYNTGSVLQVVCCCIKKKQGVQQGRTATEDTTCKKGKDIKTEVLMEDKGAAVARITRGLVVIGK